MPFGLLVVVGFLSMLAQDYLAAMLGVAEARGRAKLVAGLKVLQDGAQLLTIGIGIGYAKEHGFSVRSGVVVGALMSASALGGYLGTKQGADEIDVAVEGED